LVVEHLIEKISAISRGSGIENCRIIEAPKIDLYFEPI